MPQLFANNISTTLNGTITTGATSLIVASATGFPTPAAPDYFYMTISDPAETMWEVVKVTAVSGTTFTIVRAQDGTAAVAWTTGATIEMRPVAQGLRDIITFSNLGIRGQFKNLLSSSTGASVTVTETVDEIILENPATNLYMVARALALAGAVTTGGANGIDNSIPQAVTATSATPCVFTLASHGFPLNAAVVLGGTTAPTGFTLGTTYYVTAPTATTFQLALSANGAAIASTSTGTAVTVCSVGANSTWYSKWIIYNPATATAALLFSSSTTKPVLPSGYTYSARTGWIRLDSSGNSYPLHFLQTGREVAYIVGATGNVTNNPVLVQGAIGSGNSAWGVVSVSNAVPPTAVEIDLACRTASATAVQMVAPNSAYSVSIPTTTSVNWSPVFNSTPSGFFVTTPFRIKLESTNIYVIQSDTTAGTVSCRGWVDNL